MHRKLLCQLLYDTPDLISTIFLFADAGGIGSGGGGTQGERLVRVQSPKIQTLPPMRQSSVALS